MKLKAITAAFVAATAVAALSACEVEEDPAGTAADRADVNSSDGTNTAKPDKADAPKETVNQKNARRSAAEYLDISAHSRKGLIKQLKFEGYSQADAAYGVDAQKADWNKQAALAAQEYLDLSAHSRDGLIKQLEFEGYTHAQAVYGVNRVGLK